MFLRCSPGHLRWRNAGGGGEKLGSVAHETVADLLPGGADGEDVKGRQAELVQRAAGEFRFTAIAGEGSDDPHLLFTPCIGAVRAERAGAIDRSYRGEDLLLIVAARTIETRD